MYSKTRTRQRIVCVCAGCFIPKQELHGDKLIQCHQNMEQSYFVKGYFCWHCLIFFSKISFTVLYCVTGEMVPCLQKMTLCALGAGTHLLLVVENDVETWLIFCKYIFCPLDKNDHTKTGLPRALDTCVWSENLPVCGFALFERMMKRSELES